MKKGHLLRILLTACILYSCSDDDNVPLTEGDTLVGKWKLVSITDGGQPMQGNECERKSIIEFNDTNTFKDIAVIDDENSTNCIYDGFGVSGTFVLNNQTLIRTNVAVIAIPDELNNPVWIEEAKGENEPEIISLENGKLKITQMYEEQGETFSTSYIYESTTDDFFTE